jgi:phospholipid/cholesterol/gamma-HCH transport system substrate-binding protein
VPPSGCPPLFRGDSGYEVTATFENAGQLVKGNQVEVGGRPIGSITDIELTADARARVTMKLDDYTPLRRRCPTRARSPTSSRSSCAT